MVWGIQDFFGVGVEPSAVTAGDVKEEEFGGESVGGDVGLPEGWMPCFRAVRTLRDWDVVKASE